VAAFDKRELTDLLDQISIEWFLDQQGAQIKDSWGHSGRQLNVKECPFCGDSRWRLYVNADTGLGNCFAGSCPQGGFNKYQLLKAYKNDTGSSTLVGMLRRLVSDQGLIEFKREIFEPDPSELKLPNGTMTVDELGEVPEYLQNRKVDADTCRRFDLQWSECGRFKVTTPAGVMTQDYSKRVIIPVYDFDGSLVTFQGRDATGTHERRYMFPPAFAGTGAYLYNGNNYTGQEVAVLSEGVFDVIAVDQALRAADLHREYHPMGTFGLNLSSGRPDGNDQVTRLAALKKQGLKAVVFMFDGEAKAIKAAVTAAELCRSHGLKTFIAHLPKGKDPAETTPEVVIECLKSAKPSKSKLDEVTIVARAKSFYGNA
jgi:DNA primase